MKLIQTDKAPKAIGPYNQGIKVSGPGKMAFVSGQLPIDPKTGKMKEDIKSQMIQSLTNLKAIIESANMSLNNVVKTTIFLQNMSDFAVINQVYAEFFSSHHPARSTVEVAKLPLGALVEVEAIVYVTDATCNQK
jgi:2-iminobutanoate/2-iminopropanoate deaminase